MFLDVAVDIVSWYVRRTMTFDDLIREFRFAKRAATEIGVARQTLYYWRDNGVPPERIPAIRKIIAARQKKRKPT